MVVNIPAKFHGHSTSRSKVIKRGCLHPPLVTHQPKKLGINRVKRAEKVIEGFGSTNTNVAQDSFFAPWFLKGQNRSPLNKAKQSKCSLKVLDYRSSRVKYLLYLQMQYMKCLMKRNPAGTSCFNVHLTSITSV